MCSGVNTDQLQIRGKMSHLKRLREIERTVEKHGQRWGAKGKFQAEEKQVDREFKEEEGMTVAGEKRLHEGLTR